VAGVSRKTMQRHIKQGKVSCEVHANGHKLIDTSELLRAYGKLKPSDSPDSVTQGEPSIQHNAPVVSLIFDEKIKMLEEQVEELRKDKERLLGIVEQQTRMLPHQLERKGFWRRVFGT